MKSKWYVYLSLWLSLGSVLSSCGSAEVLSRPLEAAAEVSPVPFPNVSDVQEINRAQRQLQEEFKRTSTTFHTVSRSASRPTTTTTRLRRSPSTTEAAPDQSGSWTNAQVSFYGPGLYGNGTACGQRMTSSLVGVAHRSLPCGTMITFEYNGIEVTVPVVDRGPYVGGRTWDLTAAACQRLRHCFTGPIHWRR